LRAELEEYNNSGFSKWLIKLPDGERRHGYHLDIKRREDAQSVTRNFWAAHRDSGKDIRIVYTEYLFFLSRADLLVFRYYDVNDQTSPEAALADLENRHKDAFDSFTKRGKKLQHKTPYVSWGEITARDIIVNWFSEHQAIKVEAVIPAHIPKEKQQELWTQSLILLGAGPGNLFITRGLKPFPQLDFSVDIPSSSNGDRGGRVIVKNKPSDEELQSWKESNKFKVTRTKLGCVLEYYPENKWALVILTRIPNINIDPPIPITIINSDYSRAVFQVASFLTNETQMRAGVNLPPLLPTYFQALYAVPTRLPDTNELLYEPGDVELLAFRNYDDLLQ
jgi:hypothetical protein